MITSALAARTMGSYPISIGTALALESINMGPNQPYDQAREIPNHVKLSGYAEFWVNLLTLFRNIVGAVPTEDFYKLTAKDVADVLMHEVELIAEIIQQESGGKTQPVFYSSAYAGMMKRYKHALLRSDHTGRQKHYTELMVDSINEFYRQQGKSPFQRHFTCDIEAKGKPLALILTNYAYDLVNYPEFAVLDLLESHTGVLKPRSLWYTKYHSGKNLMRIPFNRGFLQVFGDSNTFSPHAKILRDAVMALAERYQWNHTTTRDRIMMGINQLSSQADKMLLKEMFSA